MERTGLEPATPSLQKYTSSRSKSLETPLFKGVSGDHSTFAFVIKDARLDAMNGGSGQQKW